MYREILSVVFFFVLYRCALYLHEWTKGIFWGAGRRHIRQGHRESGREIPATELSVFVNFFCYL